MSKIKIDYVKVKELLDQGYSYVKIAEELNVKAITINCYMLRHFGKVDRGNKPVKLTLEQKQVLFGSLMGDGHLSLSKKAKNPTYKEEHCIKQVEYIKYKLNFLLSLTTNKKVRFSNRFDIRFKVQNYKSCYFTLNANPEFNKIYNMFYNNKKKFIPKDLSLLTPLAIAIWFMDDGFKCENGYKISTCAFELKDIERLVIYLKNNYNLNITINKNKNIYIKASSREDFTKLIKKFIIPEMEYKLHI